MAMERFYGRSYSAGEMAAFGARRACHLACLRDAAFVQLLPRLPSVARSLLPASCDVPSHADLPD